MIADRYVYIIENEFGVPCYVGAGSGNRLDHHIMAAQGKKKPANSESEKHLYLVDCIKRGILLKAYKVAEGLTIEQAMGYERTLIAWYGRRDLGTGCLFNVCDGGFGLKNYSAKTRALISRRVKEAMTPEIRALMSRKGKARFFDPQERARVSANTRKQFATKGHPRTGKKNTQETCNYISTKTKEAMARPEVHAKVLTGLRIAMAKPEVRAKLSASARNHWTPESRAKQADRCRIMDRSPETTAKRAQSIKDSWTVERRAAYSKRRKGTKLSNKTKELLAAKTREQWANPNSKLRSAETKAKMSGPRNIIYSEERRSQISKAQSARRAREKAAKQKSSEVGTPA